MNSGLSRFKLHAYLVQKKLQLIETLVSRDEEGDETDEYAIKIRPAPMYEWTVPWAQNKKYTYD